jgi:hypothetical protein
MSTENTKRAQSHCAHSQGKTRAYEAMTEGKASAPQQALDEQGALHNTRRGLRRRARLRFPKAAHAQCSQCLHTNPLLHRCSLLGLLGARTPWRITTERLALHFAATHTSGNSKGCAGSLRLCRAHGCLQAGFVQTKASGQGAGGDEGSAPLLKDVGGEEQ